MNRVLDIKQYHNQNFNSIIGFDNQGGDGWERWYRYITVNGQRIFEIGNVCGTCEVYFKKLMELDPEIEEREVAKIMNNGISNIDDVTLQKIMKIIPSGDYVCSLTRIKPTINSENDYFSNEQIETWGIDSFAGINKPGTKYYRGNNFEVKNKELFIELIIPTQSSKIDEQRVEYYIEKLKKGENTTCLSLTVLDIKAPGMWEDENEPKFNTHWCLSNYLIDGHHKVEASRRCGIPITMLSLINKHESIIEKDEQVEELLSKMKSQPITHDDDRITPTS